MRWADPRSWNQGGLRHQARHGGRGRRRKAAGRPTGSIATASAAGSPACAPGIADYLGAPILPVRLAAVLCLVFFFIPALIAYAVCAVVLRPRPAALFASAQEEAFWRDVRAEPADVLHRLRTRFRAIDRRVGRMETLVTSDEFDLRRGFRDLDD